MCWVFEGLCAEAAKIMIRQRSGRISVFLPNGWQAVPDKPTMLPVSGIIGLTKSSTRTEAAVLPQRRVPGYIPDRYDGSAAG